MAIDSPPRPPSEDELDALIPEARDRQRRRRMIGAAALGLVAGLTVGIYAFIGRTTTSNTPARNRAGGGAAFTLCRTSNLRISVVRSGAAAGTVGGYLAFKNRGSSACALQGWPTLTAFRDGASATAKHVRYTMFGPYLHGTGSDVHGMPRVILRRGKTAVAAFTAGDNGLGPSGACPPSFRHLRVTPPGNTASAVIPAWIAWYGRNLPDCTAIVVSMVVPAADMPPRG